MAVTNAQGTNYRETFFQHADLTPVRGEPKNDTVKILINECSANAQTVHSNLGGGAHGHLGLVLMPLKYDTIATGTPYTRPTYPGALVIPPGTTNVQAQMMREQHQQDLHAFHETEAVHNALVQQVVKAVEPMYLKALRNPVTQAFILPLNEILHHLMTVYGKLNPKMLRVTKNALETFQYNVSLPVDVVFDPIDDLEELAALANEPMSEAQKIAMAFIIFQNTGKFKSDLKSWNRKAPHDKTWTNMKTHFRDALQDARDVEDEPIAQAFDQANMISEVLEGVRAIVRDQVAEAILPQGQVNPYQPPTVPRTNIDGSVQHLPQANNTYHLQYQPSDYATMHQPIFEYANQVHQQVGMQQPPQQPPNQPPPIQYNNNMQPQQSGGQQQGFSNFSNGRRGRGRSRGGRRNRTNNYQQQQFVQPQQQYSQGYQHQYQNNQGQQGFGQGQGYQGFQQQNQGNNQYRQQMQPRNQQRNGPTRRNTSQYCWTHGACAHTGWQCGECMVGHVPHATFQNRCGGCNDFCE